MEDLQEDLQFPKEGKKHIDDFLRVSGVSVVSKKRSRRLNSAGTVEHIYLVYLSRKNEKPRSLELVYFPEPWNSIKPQFRISYCAELAYGPKEVKKFRNSDLLGKIRKMKGRPNGLVVRFLDHVIPDGVDGITFLAERVDPANNDEWHKLARYAGTVDSMARAYAGKK